MNPGMPFRLEYMPLIVLNIFRPTIFKHRVCSVSILVYLISAGKAELPATSSSILSRNVPRMKVAFVVNDVQTELAVT